MQKWGMSHDGHCWLNIPVPCHLQLTWRSPRAVQIMAVLVTYTNSYVWPLFLQVDLLVLHVISGLAVQGMPIGTGRGFPKTYLVLVSPDREYTEDTFTALSNEDGTDTVSQCTLSLVVMIWLGISKYIRRLWKIRVCLFCIINNLAVAFWRCKEPGQQEP